MNLVGFVSTAVLSLTLVAATPVFAQEQREQPEEKSKSTQPEEKKAKPEEKKAPEKNTGQKKQAAQQQDKNKQQQEKNAQQQKHESKAQPVKQNQHNGGGRIPADRYKANFGREHRFRVSQADYSNGRRFQYGGYSFGFVDPWPSNWLYTQDVYVVEINGMYFLCNPMYPGVNLALSFTL